MNELDGFIETSEVERLSGRTRRWLSEMIKAGTFPKPDVPGRLGSSHRWRRSTIQKWLDDTVASANAPSKERTPTTQKAA